MRREQQCSGFPVAAVPQARWDMASMAASMEADVHDFATTCRAEFTVQTYESQLAQFVAFCKALQRLGHPRLPVAQSVAQWIMCRALHGYKLATITLRVTAVNDMVAKRHPGVPFVTGDTLVRRCLAAAARRKSAVERPKMPVLLDLLRKLLQPGPETYADVRDRAFYLLGWLGIFRASELLQLCWGHFEFPVQGVAVTIWSPKRIRRVAGRSCLWGPRVRML